MCEIWEEVRREGEARGEANGEIKGMAASVRSLMARMKISANEAMDMLSVPLDKQEAVQAVL